MAGDPRRSRGADDGRQTQAAPAHGRRRGINLARLLDEPGPIDPAAWAHGASFLPRTETGARVEADTGRAFERPLCGGTLRFMLLLD
jgi:hypothetical protein